MKRLNVVKSKLKMLQILNTLALLLIGLKATLAVCWNRELVKQKRPFIKLNVMQDY
jgi:hypothetical protein